MTAATIQIGRANLPVCPNFKDGERSDAIVSAAKHRCAYFCEISSTPQTGSVLKPHPPAARLL